jgi:hypothetical protein
MTMEGVLAVIFLGILVVPWGYRQANRDGLA